MKLTNFAMLSAAALCASVVPSSVVLSSVLQASALQESQLHDAPVPIAAEGLKISSAWVRVPAPGSTVTALYFTVQNLSSTAQTISKISVDGAKRTEMHQTVTDAKGMVSMQPLTQAKIEPHTTLSFAPGGNHAMVFGAPLKLKAGEKIKVTLDLVSGAKVKTEAVARSPGESDASQHQHGDSGTATQHHHE